MGSTGQHLDLIPRAGQHLVDGVGGVAAGKAGQELAERLDLLGAEGAGRSALAAPHPS